MAVKLEVVKPLQNNRAETNAYYNNLGESGAGNFSVRNNKRNDVINNGLMISAGLIGMNIAHNETMYKRISKITNDLKICPQNPIIKENIKKNETLLKDLKFKKPLLTTIVSIAFGFFMAIVCEWVAKEMDKRRNKAKSG